MAAVEENDDSPLPRHNWIDGGVEMVEEITVKPQTS